MKRSLLSIALLAGLASANAQPMLVKDINPGTAGSFPTRMMVNNKKLVFAANDGTNGFELWMRDTSATLAYNINPAAASSIPTTQHRTMAMSGKFMYFPANNGTSGTELYRWDGTSAPMLAAEIAAGGSSSNVDELVSFRGKIYFDANDNINGEELWVYDTTNNIASRLTDINVGASSSIISSITVFDTLIYFAAFNGTTGTELYSYNPTTNNTVLVSDIDAGVNSSSPNNFMVVGNRLYFTATTVANGRELYVFNGMTAMRLTDVTTGFGNGITTTVTGQKVIAALNNKIYFPGNDATGNGHLYMYDPANGITSLVYRTHPTGSSNVSNLFAVKNKIYFSGENGTNGNELWMYSGVGVPSMVADIYPGANSSFPAEFIVIEKNIFFRASDSVNGGELFMMTDTSLTNVKNITFAGNVTVYPNPTAANVNMDITLEKAQTLTVTVADMAGRVVYQNNNTAYSTGRNTVAIPMANAAAGVYLYTLKDEQGRMMATGRLVKQ